MKKKIEVFDYASEIIKALSTGILLTTKAGDKVNTMTVGWGNLGVVWGKSTFTAFIRKNRFTSSQLAKNPEFTINIPHGDFNKKILGFCGTKSGRDVDKIEALNLTLEAPEIIAVPAVRELPLTLECRAIYVQKQDEHAIAQETKKKYYPQDVDSFFYDANKDFHTVYYGEIVSAYIIE
ncbi:flavin reductase family protein [Pectinatus haikarae]|uniref:Flavin reductase (DIM6/NTAB) family NADH-FMN oxidoreductase RutF n=1 Tax=Pectinatus haikarae TaxID=349096 RepID=A0ABT9Y743_9FIRM|nr:flavin reductase family protein [Pectinatus haikarae]MDQ0203644.1 flavin reductase (DIM6/NTAB) family NADH-FMN oxidoreductase RutF [Pectinatus haikarae]